MPEPLATIDQPRPGTPAIIRVGEADVSLDGRGWRIRPGASQVGEHGDLIQVRVALAENGPQAEITMTLAQAAGLIADLGKALAYATHDQSVEAMHRAINT